MYCLQFVHFVLEISAAGQVQLKDRIQRKAAGRHIRALSIYSLRWNIKILDQIRGQYTVTTHPSHPNSSFGRWSLHIWGHPTIPPNKLSQSLHPNPSCPIQKSRHHNTGSGIVFWGGIVDAIHIISAAAARKKPQMACLLFYTADMHVQLYTCTTVQLYIAWTEFWDYQIDPDLAPKSWVHYMTECVISSQPIESRGHFCPLWTAIAVYKERNRCGNWATITRLRQLLTSQVSGCSIFQDQGLK